ncbi:MAG: alpha-1,2-fucosyltransferase [Colwellia sp.]
MVRIKIIGGLGNQMFQYAAAKSLAVHNNEGLVADISAFKKYNVHPLRLNELNCDCEFEFKNSIFFKALEVPFISRLLSKFSSLFNVYIDSVFFELSSTASLVGYFQTEKYFSSIREVLLKNFTLKEPLREHDSLIEKAIIKTNSVSVHIRRGDYITNPSANAVHGTCDQEYFNRALKYLKERDVLLADTVLFIFSDDILWCKNNLGFDIKTTFVDADASRPEVDIHLMSKCKHNIISNSTFSWWGAWLNINLDKIVVAPSQWFSPDSGHDYSDIVPSSWHKINE